MAVGLAILTAYGSTTIDRLYDEVYATPDAYLQFIPEDRCATGRCATRSSSSALEDVGVARGGLDHGRAVRRGGRGDRRRDPAERSPSAVVAASRTRMLDDAAAAHGTHARPTGPLPEDPTPMASNAPEPGLAL